MAYRGNPFLERMSESTTSDIDFVQLFSPKILDKLDEGVFGPGIHIFRSAPGAGKTTLLRVFTPLVLQGFWKAHRRGTQKHESFQKLVDRDVLTSKKAPEFLGIFLSCASGYADLPPGSHTQHEGLFRALLDCRIVLRTLRSASALLGSNYSDQLSKIELKYDDSAKDLKGIPLLENAQELAEWAEKYERKVYVQLDAFNNSEASPPLMHSQFEGPLWLQSVTFHFEGDQFAKKHLLMIDDLHKLRRKQRTMLVDELVVQRVSIPIWLAERSIALGTELISQGSRPGREIHEYSLEEMWKTTKGPKQFVDFAQSILDRRMEMQSLVPSRSFVNCLQSETDSSDSRKTIAAAIERVNTEIQNHKGNARFSEWVTSVEKITNNNELDELIELYATRILFAREEMKRQRTLDFALAADELVDRNNSQVKSAAEIFIHDQLKLPYYFGLDRLCSMASNNIEELLSLAAALYVGLQSKQVLRKQELVLSPKEQEKILQDAATKKRNFVPRGHTQGSRAGLLLDSIGVFCREKTFVANAPYAPGVTGVRLSATQLNKAENGSGKIGERTSLLMKVLAECAADNLIITKQSKASTGRESGIVFYLNRTLCAHYGLPLQYGGWQDVESNTLVTWMDLGLSPKKKSSLGII